MPPNAIRVSRPGKYGDRFPAGFYYKQSSVQLFRRLS